MFYTFWKGQIHSAIGQDTEKPNRTGGCEEIIGRALKGKRDQVVLSTKVGLRTGHCRMSADAFYPPAKRFAQT
jgi:predicted aldo/keto reductase-like oxidoreductase